MLGCSITHLSELEMSVAFGVSVWQGSPWLSDARLRDGLHGKCTQATVVSVGCDTNFAARYRCVKILTLYAFVDPDTRTNIQLLRGSRLLSFRGQRFRGKRNSNSLTLRAIYESMVTVISGVPAPPMPRYSILHSSSAN